MFFFSLFIKLKLYLFHRCGELIRLKFILCDPCFDLQLSRYLDDGNFIRVAHALETLMVLFQEIFKKRFSEQLCTLLSIIMQPREFPFHVYCNVVFLYRVLLWLVWLLDLWKMQIHILQSLSIESQIYFRETMSLSLWNPYLWGKCARM